MSSTLTRAAGGGEQGPRAPAESSILPSAVALAFDRQRAAMAVTSVTATEKAVLLVLAIMANGDGAAWPPISGPTGIAARASLSRRGVQEALRGLELKGLVEREARPGHGATYTLRLGVRAGRACAPGAHVQEARGGCAPGAPKQPENNHRKKASPSPKGRAAARNAIEALPDLPAGVTPEQWAEYVETRVAMARGAKGRPWTAGAARQAITKLHALAEAGHDPAASLAASVLNGWQGLFPQKDDRDGNHNRPRAGDAAQPRRGFGADMLAAALARPADDTEGDPRDSGGAEGPVPAWLRGGR